jgi:hypothetical protein
MNMNMNMNTILNLILYNDSPIYDEMKKILTDYLSTQNIKFFFYCYKKDLDQEYLIDGNMLYIRGEETYLPGILEKTIKAIEICQQFEFDYLLRSNISTIVNINLLNKYLQQNTFDYGGSSIYNLQWLDPQCGIHDHRYRGTKYIHGTGIILSRKAMQLLIQEKQYINYDVIDDVALGLFFKNHHPNLIEIGQTYNSPKYIDNVVFYRNKNSDRNKDVKNMKNIIYGIINKKIDI